MYYHTTDDKNGYSTPDWWNKIENINLPEDFHEVDSIDIHMDDAPKVMEKLPKLNWNNALEYMQTTKGKPVFNKWYYRFQKKEAKLILKTLLP
jgi:hypothetical protein